MNEPPQAREDVAEAALANAPTVAGPIVPAPQAPAEPPYQAPAPAPQPASAAPVAPAGSASAGNHPERAVAAAFAGGFVLALILKRLAR